MGSVNEDAGGAKPTVRGWARRELRPLVSRRAAGGGARAAGRLVARPHVAVRAPLFGPLQGARAEVLSDTALEFLAGLARQFEPERQQLLRRRHSRQRELDAGRLPAFLSATRRIRETEWQVTALPAEFTRLRVEVAGPVARGALQQALRSGADLVLADFDDFHAPTWRNNLDGQVNLREAAHGHRATPGGLSVAASGRACPRPCLMVRPRGWHLQERHLLVDGIPIAAALFDAGLYLFHNAHALQRSGTPVYFSLPKLENHLEARLWRDVFAAATATLGMAPGAVRVTVRVENILAACEMDEMLWELRAHAVGLEHGGSAYTGSFVEKFSRRRDFLLPERREDEFERDGLRAYTRLLVGTCRRRGVSAIGPLSSATPVAGDPAEDWRVLERLLEGTRAEYEAGFTAVRVAYPGFVSVAQLARDERCAGDGRTGGKNRPAPAVEAAELLAVAAGEITIESVRANIDLVLRYVNGWLGGSGRVPVGHRLEGSAAAELARGQLWQWAYHRAVLRDGRRVNPLWLRQLIGEQLQKLRREGGRDSSRLGAAGLLIERSCLGPECSELLSAAAHQFLG